LFHWLSQKATGLSGKKASDFMVEDAVQVEHVSATKFPANREINREDRKSVLQTRKRSNSAATSARGTVVATGLVKSARFDMGGMNPVPQAFCQLPAIKVKCKVFNLVISTDSHELEYGAHW
jgi:hypothetical protein